MNIISHRGFWKSEQDKNSLEAFEASFSMGLGVETDVRDFGGELVISHDVPAVGAKIITFEEFLQLAVNYSSTKFLTLALNIKSDGLAKLVHEQLATKDCERLGCFVFDMSVPDMRDYFSYGFNVYTRLSEVEPTPAWITACSGVWMDSFESQWFDLDLVREYLSKNKKVCIVSSELHGRDRSELWNLIHSLRNEAGLMLCTDFPLEADRFFNGRS
jgi:hypothetical protein